MLFFKSDKTHIRASTFWSLSLCVWRKGLWRKVDCCLKKGAKIWPCLRPKTTIKTYHIKLLNYLFVSFLGLFICCSLVPLLDCKERLHSFSIRSMSPWKKEPHRKQNWTWSRTSHHSSLVIGCPGDQVISIATNRCAQVKNRSIREKEWTWGESNFNSVDTHLEKTTSTHPNVLSEHVSLPVCFWCGQWIKYLIFGQCEIRGI